MEKNSFSKIANKVDDTSKKIDTIMRNRLAIAIFMIVDGINFIVNPNKSMEDMARAVAIFAILASFAVLITNIRNKKKDIKSIIIAILIVILCIIILVFPQLLSYNLRGIMALFIIFNSLINIFNILKLDRISLYISKIDKKIKDKFSKEEIDKDLKDGIIEQTTRVINPLNTFIEQTNTKSYVYLILNIVSVILGALLISSNTATIRILGVILLYTGILDFLMASKSMNLSKKLKDKDFKSILFGEVKNDER